MEGLTSIQSLSFCSPLSSRPEEFNELLVDPAGDLEDEEFADTMSGISRSWKSSNEFEVSASLISKVSVSVQRTTESFSSPLKTSLKTEKLQLNLI